LEPEAPRKNGVRGVEGWAEGLADPVKTMNRDSSHICVGNIVEVERAVDTNRVWEGVLGDDFGDNFEEGRRGIGRAKRRKGEGGGVHERTDRMGRGWGSRQTGWVRIAKRG
jgi:hypothetical protein